MNERDSLEEYFRGILGECKVVEFRALGRGVHGTGFLVKVETSSGIKNYVLKDLSPEGLGHDYPSDRAAVHLLALDNYGKLPHHVKAVEVLSRQGDGTLTPIGGATEYYLLMEEAKGVSYFKDLEDFAKKDRLDALDIDKIRIMAAYLKEIHSVRLESRTLYLRKLREIIGHGECLMGVFDSYPADKDKVLSHEEMAGIEKLCIDWRARLKDKWRRLCQIHGDFHPGNIWWGGTAPRESGTAPGENGDNIDNSDKKSLWLLDRSRGEWGEAADDITALAINYLFFSIRHFNGLKGAYFEGFKLFFDEYLRLTGDEEVLGVLAPFFAFRGAVVANPAFYPELTLSQRHMILGFVRNALKDKVFSPQKADEYLKIRRKSTKI